MQSFGWRHSVLESRRVRVIPSLNSRFNRTVL